MVIKNMLSFRKGQHVVTKTKFLVYISCSYDVLVLLILMHLLFKYTSNILLRKASISEVTIISFLQMLIIDHLVQKLYYLLSKMNVKEIGPFFDAYQVVTYKNIKSVPLYIFS